MRIIEQGILPSEYQIRCKNCNTLFVAEEKELGMAYQGYYKVKTIRCPYCKVLLLTSGDTYRR